MRASTPSTWMRYMKEQWSFSTPGEQCGCMLSKMSSCPCQVWCILFYLITLDPFLRDHPKIHPQSGLLKSGPSSGNVYFSYADGMCPDERTLLIPSLYLWAHCVWFTIVTILNVEDSYYPWDERDCEHTVSLCNSFPLPLWCAQMQQPCLHLCENSIAILVMK